MSGFIKSGTGIVEVVLVSTGDGELRGIKDMLGASFDCSDKGINLSLGSFSNLRTKSSDTNSIIGISFCPVNSNGFTFLELANGILIILLPVIRGRG